MTKSNFGNTVERMINVDKELVQDLKSFPAIKSSKTFQSTTKDKVSYMSLFLGKAKDCQT